MKQDLKDRFLAHWLNGELPEEEVRDFIGQEDIDTYKKIVGELKTWSVKSLDKNASYDRLKGKRETRSSGTEVVKLNPTRKWMSIAATVVVMLGVYFIYQTFFSDPMINIETLAGQTKLIELPDGSKAQLNANTRLTYNKADFFKNRSVNLDGHAFFEVEKGAGFLVHFKQGSVKVLGTKFDVMARAEYRDIQCYEGSVSVSSVVHKDSVVLYMEKAVRFSDVEGLYQYQVLDKSPLWLSGTSKFKDAAIKEVILSLEATFGIKIEVGKNVSLKQKFTGVFVHSDLNLALKMVFEPLGITYKAEHGTVHLSN